MTKNRGLTNPYARIEPSESGVTAAAGFVLAGVAGLAVLGAGTASAQTPVEDGLGSSPLDSTGPLEFGFTPVAPDLFGPALTGPVGPVFDLPGSDFSVADSTVAALVPLVVEPLVVEPPPVGSPAAVAVEQAVEAAVVEAVPVVNPGVGAIGITDVATTAVLDAALAPASVDPGPPTAPSPGSATAQASVRFGADGERTGRSNTQAEQAAMLASLGTEEGRRRVQDLLTAERVVTDPDGLDLFVADVAERLRQVAVGSTPLTREQADALYPIPSQEPLLATMPESMRPSLQAYYDRKNAQLAERAMASSSGFQAPEIACWLVCDTDGTARVLPELHVGLNGQVGGTESTLDGLDLSGVTDLVGLHTHPLYATADPPLSYDTTGLSAADIGFLDTFASWLPPDVRPAEAAVSLLEGTVVIARRGPLPDGTPHPDPDGARGPLLVRVLPSTPGAPVSSDIKIQVDDPGTLDFSLADAMEAPGVSEQRYAAARRAVEEGLDPTALTDPPDLYGPGVVAPGVRTAEGLDSRGLVVAPPVSAVDLPLPTALTDRSVDPEVEGGGDPSQQLPAGVGSPDAERSGPGPGGTVVRPDPGLPWSEQVRLGLVRAPGDWANEPTDELPDIAVPDGRPVDPDEFDPNRTAGDAPAVPPAPEQERFPSGPDLGDPLWPGVPGLFAGAPVTERDRLPGARTPTAPEGEPTVQPGSTRVGADGRVQTLVASQALVGDGRAGTVPGRTDFFRGEDGRVEAVTTSPRRKEDDGTELVWIPNLGTSLSSNPAGRVTSVQGVAGPQYPSGTSTRAVRIRTGDSTQRLAGDGSLPGSVTYRAVPGSPQLQDVLVEPSTSEVPHADGSSTLVRTTLVPANRQWNASGAPERFRVEVGTRMLPVSRQVFVPAPAPVLDPAYDPGYDEAPAPAVPEALTSSPEAGGARVVPSPALTAPSPRRVSRPAPPAPQPRPEPTWQDRAGQAGEALWNVLTYPHPLSPRGVLGPVIWGPAAAERQWAY